MNATNMVSNANVIPNLATMTQTRTSLGECEFQIKKRTNVPVAERAKENI